MAETQLVTRAHDVGVESMRFTTGTWTYSDNSGNPKFSKSANAETTVISIPFHPTVSTANTGEILTSIIVPITIGVADLTSYTWTLYKSDLSGLLKDGSVALPTITATAQTDNGAVTTHANPTAFTISVTTPAAAGSASTNTTNPHSYLLVGSLVCPASTTLAVFKATFNFTEIK